MRLHLLRVEEFGVATGGGIWVAAGELWSHPNLLLHGHNVLLNYAFGLGLLGLLSILGLFGSMTVYWVSLIGHSDKKLSAIGAAGAALVIGVFLKKLTNDFFQRDLSLLFWTITGVLVGHSRIRLRMEQKKNP